MLYLWCCFEGVMGECFFFFFKQKTAYEVRISDWSSDVCSSDLLDALARAKRGEGFDVLAISIDRSGMGAVRRFLDDNGIETLEEIGRASCRERVCQYV